MAELQAAARLDRGRTRGKAGATGQAARSCGPASLSQPHRPGKAREPPAGGGTHEPPLGVFPMGTAGGPCAPGAAGAALKTAQNPAPSPPAAHPARQAERGGCSFLAARDGEEAGKIRVKSSRELPSDR